MRTRFGTGRAVADRHGVSKAQVQSGAVVAEVKAANGDAAAVVVDVSKEEDIKKMVEFAVSTYGRLDVALNNPGTEGVFAPLVEQNAERYDMVFEPNVRGVFNSMKYEAEVMLKQGSGSIINTASMGDLIGFDSASLYIASQHAVVGMTKTASIEWKLGRKLAGL